MKKSSLLNGTMLCLILIFTSCQLNQRSYHISNGSLKHQYEKLQTLLLREESDAIRFVIANQIATILNYDHDPYQEIYFRTHYPETHPGDAYNGYHLTRAADLYAEMDARPFAVFYYQNVILNHPDLLIDNSSIHYYCLSRLVQFSDSKEEKIGYYKRLLSEFQEYLDDKGQIYFALATLYEETGEWEQAIQSYKQFLQYPETKIAGITNAQVKIQEKIDFYHSDYTSWAVKDLNFLVNQIRLALRTKNLALLEKYRSKSHFITMYWNQKAYNEIGSRFFNMWSFLKISYVMIEDDLDADSNSQEAYLRTSNWAYRDPVWYFYFRRINFPADPEVNDAWEWTGIYFGEKNP
ncbi:MAG: hypothetical protein JXR70_15145 [Spirochaetales bacterium]|nr:hypothetical protein [Spirochaetales bacterium]